MILADTSVWVDHFRTGDDGLVSLLEHGRIAAHPFVIGELACGNLRNRGEILSYMRDLPQAGILSHEEVLFFIEQHRLMGLGIGYVDVHLLGAVALAPPMRIWTRDRRLLAAARLLDLSHEMPRNG